MALSTKITIFFCFFMIVFTLGMGCYMTELWQKKEDMFKNVNTLMQRVEITLDMRSNLRNMTLSSRNMIIDNNPDNIAIEWQNLLEQRELYLRNRKLLIENLANESYKPITNDINTITTEDSRVLSSLLTPGRLILEGKHEEASEYTMGIGRKKQRFLFDTLTSLSNHEKEYGKKLIENYVSESSLIIIIVSVIFLSSTIMTIITLLYCIFLSVRIEEVKELNNHFNSVKNPNESH